MEKTSQKPTADTRQAYARLYPMTTRFRDNDRYGHLNNVVYGEYFDAVVNQCLEELGIVAFDSDTPIGLVVTSYTHYFASVSFPESVEVGLRVASLGKTSVHYEFALFKKDRELACAQGGYTHVFCNRATLTPEALSDTNRQRLETLMVR